jgi:hypothetical protein
MHFTIGLNGVSSLCVLGISYSQRRAEARDVNLFASFVGVVTIVPGMLVW